MSSIRHSPKTTEPSNDYTTISNPGISTTPYTRQSIMSGVPILPAPSPSTPSLPEESRKPAGMRGGMSQFRAQPVYSKQKLRVKQYDPSKRNYVAENSEVKDRVVLGERNGQITDAERPQERTPVSVQNTQSYRFTDDDLKDIMLDVPSQDHSPAQNNSTYRFTDEDIKDIPGDRTPRTKDFASKSELASIPVNQAVPDFTPERLAGIVSFSITKCREKHLTTLGLAIKRLWQDTNQEPRLAHLIAAVLSQNASDEEKTELQHLITIKKNAAKAEIAEHKAKHAKPAASVSTGSKTPSRTESPPDYASNTNAKSPLRRTRQSARKSTSAHLQVEDEPKERTPSVNGKRSRAPAPAAEEPSSKRQKRSNSSVSSGSSLSSAPSDIDQDVEMSDTPKATRSNKKMITLHVAPKPVDSKDPKNKGPPKKVMGSFDGPRINGKVVNTADDPASQARKQKKQDLLKTFDHVKVTSSHLRKTPESIRGRSVGEDLFPNLSISSANSRGRKKDTDDLESLASSTQEDLLVPPPPEARRSSRSRQATPNAQRLRAINPRISARVKVSPHKKGSGIAGLAQRTSRSQEVHLEDSDDEDIDRDNNDFCSACGASGRLLCCDGCTRSFHFICLDPPMDENNPPEGHWFCFHCQDKLTPHHRARRGIFSMLRSQLKKSNTSAYSLPKHTRDYYEGVGTGDNGEYLDVPSSGKIKISKLPGYDEEKKQDNTKLTDKKGQAILCFSCGGCAMGKREIVACDHCGLYWHLDCLNPPLANPPFRDPQNRAKYRWMCPAHADSVINAAGPNGRLYKTRRPRNARIIDTQLTRGFKSNGIIEIELEESEEEESEIEDEPPIYRVTERSIRLDFNDRLRRDKEESLRRQAVLQRMQEREEQDQQSTMQAYRSRSRFEKDAVSSLIDLAKSSSQPSIEPDTIREVVQALVLEAPDSVIPLLERELASNTVTEATTSPVILPKEVQIRQFLMLQELINQKLAELTQTK